MSRHAQILDKEWVVKCLRNVRNTGRTDASYHLTRQLVDQKLIRPVFMRNAAGRGRPLMIYGLSKIGDKILSGIQMKLA